MDERSLFSWHIENDEVIIDKYDLREKCENPVIINPSMFDGKPTTAIASRAFMNPGYLMISASRSIEDPRYNKGITCCNCKYLPCCGIVE